jgi:nitrate reductase delta subunit
VRWRTGGADEPTRRLAWQAASVLLSYPEDATSDRVDAARAMVTALPESTAEPLGRFLRWVDATPLLERAAHYVATFDQRRACSPYLTYYAHGDTRQRGMALLVLKQAYRRAGLVISPEELPDHLAVVLEFAASVDPNEGARLLVKHRAGIEVLRLALADAGSPYADVLRAVCATLPPLQGSESDAVQQLVAQGPPAEEVGLAPYGAVKPFGQPPSHQPPELPAGSITGFRDPSGART